MRVVDQLRVSGWMNNVCCFLGMDEQNGDKKNKRPFKGRENVLKNDFTQRDVWKI